jgi:hypothetical protein
MTTLFTQKKPTIFSCQKCDFKCSYKRDFNRHLLTIKHKNNEITTNNNDLGPKFPGKIYKCDICEKIFNDRAGLWRHKKKCKIEMDKLGMNEHSQIDKNYLIHLLVTQNNELINLVKNGITHTNTNNHNHTTTNYVENTFNLNFFLNEICKDAMNISEFVSSIQVTLEDLENTGRQGYIEGISKIVVKNLNNLEQHFRPIHCSDSKREVFYIKDNNAWQKENDDKPILTKAIKTIANENIKQIKHWRDKYPDCVESESKKNNMYLKIVSNSMNGITEEEGNKNISKIISNVAKEVTIDKTKDKMIDISK